MSETAIVSALARSSRVNPCEQLLEMTADHMAQLPVADAVTQGGAKRGKKAKQGVTVYRRELVCTRNELMERLGLDPTLQVARSFVQAVNAKGHDYGLSVECLTSLADIMSKGIEPQYRINYRVATSNS